MANAPHFTGAISPYDNEQFSDEVLIADVGLDIKQPAVINPFLADMHAEIKQDKLMYLEQERADAVLREDFGAAETLDKEIEALKTAISRSLQVACPQASTTFQVGDIVRIVVENEPDVQDPKRNGTANKMGQIVEENASYEAFLVRFADGRECWYKPAWLTSQKAMKAAEEEAKVAAAVATKSSCASSSTASQCASGAGSTSAGETYYIGDEDAVSDESEKLPEVSQECIQLILDGSQREERAMVFDRAGAYPGAIGLYREGASMLSEALHLMPMSHPDTSVVEVHIQEVHARANYLQSRGKEPAEIPLEEMIHGRQLRMGTCARGADTAIAAGAVLGVAGLALSGPMVGIALAAGAAYATTREDGWGKAARTVGDVGLQAADQTRALNQKYKIDEQIDEQLHISEATAIIGATARSVDERFSITQRTQAAADQTSSFIKSVDQTMNISGTWNTGAGMAGQAVSDFNENHLISDRVSIGLNDASSNLSSWVTKKVSSAAKSSADEL